MVCIYWKFWFSAAGIGVYSMYLTKVLIRFQHDLFTIHIPFTTMLIFDAGIPAIARGLDKLIITAVVIYRKQLSLQYVHVCIHIYICMCMRMFMIMYPRSCICMGSSSCIILNFRFCNNGREISWENIFVGNAILSICDKLHVPVPSYLCMSFTTHGLFSSNQHTT